MKKLEKSNQLWFSLGISIILFLLYFILTETMGNLGFFEYLRKDMIEAVKEFKNYLYIMIIIVLFGAIFLSYLIYKKEVYSRSWATGIIAIGILAGFLISLSQEHSSPQLLGIITSVVIISIFGPMTVVSASLIESFDE